MNQDDSTDKIPRNSPSCAVFLSVASEPSFLAEMHCCHLSAKTMKKSNSTDSNSPESRTRIL